MDHADYHPPGTTANTATGGASQVVQAGAIAGGVHVHATGPPAFAAPRQLPRTVTHFTGRESELDTLDAVSAGQPSTVVISAIAGMGGVGKTTLAVHWAHKRQEHFPDGTLYVDLRGFDPGPPLSPERVLTSFLTALGVPTERVPADQEAKAGLFRSTLAGRQVLVVLDNAATPHQVRPLLPGHPGCLVLITSRDRLRGLAVRDGLHRVNLDVLPPAEAHSLLRKTIGSARADHEPGAVAELARLCGHLPLALRIAADRTTDRPHLTVTDLARELATERQRLDALAEDDETTSLRAVFSWSHQALPAETAHVFRLLGLHPGPTISLAAATALTGTTSARTRRHLETLTNAHLLTETGYARYQFHDLLRDYAAERASAEEPAHSQAAATSRLYAWYLHTAHAALFAYYPQHPEIPVDSKPPDCQPLTFTTRDEARTWFTAEHANLMSIVRHAPAVNQHTVGWQLPNALDCYLSDEHHPADQITVHRLGLEAARHLGDQLGQRWAHGHLGEAYQGARRYSEAIACFHEQLIIATTIGDLFGEGAALGDLAHTYNVLGRYSEAADLSRRALAIYRAIGHRRNEAINLTNLGFALHGMGQHQEAVSLLHEGLDIAIAIEAFGLQAFALRQIGATLHRQGRSREAVEHLERAASLDLALRTDYSYAETLVELGAVLDDIGSRDQARGAWREALAILADLDPDRAAQVRARLDA
ncbi:MAG: tetratricopeptide repeat protein [Saccharothrix sp.]|nr:tetratricopeptide repeat protein [Saccharothrix sp.]